VESKGERESKQTSRIKKDRKERDLFDSWEKDKARERERGRAVGQRLDNTRVGANHP
jgi:hypothetical protein